MPNVRTQRGAIQPPAPNSPAGGRAPLCTPRTALLRCWARPEEVEGEVLGGEGLGARWPGRGSGSMESRRGAGRVGHSTGTWPPRLQNERLSRAQVWGTLALEAGWPAAQGHSQPSGHPAVSPLHTGDTPGNTYVVMAVITASEGGDGLWRWIGPFEESAGVKSGHRVAGPLPIGEGVIWPL